MPRAARKRKEWKFCAIDSEGDASPDGWKGGTWYCDDSHGFIEDHGEYIEQLRELARQGYTFAAHNAEYDVSVIFWTARETVRCHYFNTSFNRADWIFAPKLKPAQIWDTVKLSGGLSLKAVGDAMKLHKYTTPAALLGPDEETEAWTCDEHGVYQCVECYAVRDAEIVYRFMVAYQSLMKSFNAEPKRTPASAAIAIWRAIESPTPIMLSENRMAEIGRAAYFGGRVDPFIVGTVGPVYVGDVRSMYPYIMMNKPMGVPRSFELNESRYLTDEWIQLEGVSEITVHVPFRHVPVLPCKIDGKLYFPHGTVRGTWINAEIRAAVKRGAVVKAVHRVVYANAVYYPFARFVASLMALREEHLRADDPRHLMDKRIMNSLYGRMGMAEEQQEEIVYPMPANTSSKDHPFAEIRLVDTFALCTEEIRRASVHRWSNVIWAASITAYARLRLLAFIEAQGDNVAYCDTDSVFSLQPLLDTGNALGELTVEGEWEYGIIAAPKMYRLWNDGGESKARAKGVKAKYAAAYLAGEEVEYEQPYRPREASSRGHTAGVWHSVHKQRRLDLGKRQSVSLDSEGEALPWTRTRPFEAVWDDDLGRNRLLA